ncbi:hypothetical protein [Aurantiacibacter rhizosphaerae]|uniref:Uncharacterized protein n=1 Tax=Aurantiacibacter rhizosphaerae TaxID=2691582 RepID=A0A844XI12_9SPHN|nr:hypothetical protein [Aurantiacibacter rhizosphaerae]MWV29188.1 hypothetical protein [Aurantiacibacter rhizosphaerae]
MIILFGLIYAAVIGALFFGQFKVVRRALQQRVAGMGRFTFPREESPIGFWIVLGIEIAALMLASLYFAAALGILLK